MDIPQLTTRNTRKTGYNIRTQATHPEQGPSPNRIASHCCIKQARSKSVSCHTPPSFLSIIYPLMQSSSLICSPQPPRQPRHPDHCVLSPRMEAARPSSVMCRSVFGPVATSLTSVSLVGPSESPRSLLVGRSGAFVSSRATG